MGKLSHSFEKLKGKTPGIPWWLSGLRTQHCHCCGMGSILCPGTSPCCECSQKKKKKKVKSPVSDIKEDILTLPVEQLRLVSLKGLVQ